MQPKAPVIHDEPDAKGIHDAKRNISAHLQAEVGDVQKGFAEAERVFEGVYRVPHVQQSSTTSQSLPCVQGVGGSPPAPLSLSLAPESPVPAVVDVESAAVVLDDDELPALVLD